MRIGVAVIALAGAFLAAYVPDIGHGFIKDDFAWIVASRAASWHEVAALFTTNVGFYRPLVATTFAADHAFWQLNPFGYGISNLALAVADAVGLFLLARHLRLKTAGAVAAAAVWAFNFHGISMGVLWLSGRTSLLLVLFALATAHAALRQRWLLAGGCVLCAMLCKEEAMLLPLMWSVFAFVDADPERTRQRPPWARAWGRLHAALPFVPPAVTKTMPLWAAGAIYAILRLRSGAFSPSEAPSYYQFTFDAGQLLQNAGEYIDRGATVATATAILWLLVSRGTGAPWVSTERRAMRLGAIWFVAGYGLTMFLPLRSSLYAVLPSVGTALIAGAIASHASAARPVAFRRVCAGLIAATVLLVPVYRARNVRWVGAADLSTDLRRRMETIAARHPAGGTIVLRDDPTRRITFSATFDTQFPKAATLFMGELWSGELEGDLAGSRSSERGAVVTIERGELP